MIATAKKPARNFPPLPLYGAVLINHAGLLRHNGLGVVRCHSEQRNDPHPKDRTRTANDDRPASTDDISSADLCGHSSSKRLKRCHSTALISPSK